jgi:hypothetical protein
MTTLKSTTVSAERVRLFGLLPSWNVTRVFELAPINWKETSQREDVRRKLDTHPFRRVSLGLDP